MKRAYLILIDFILPLPLTAVMYLVWWRRTGSSPFAVYVLSLGVLFGYIFPGIGTNVLQLWKFHGPFRIGNYFVHHGFLYAPYLALVFYVAFPSGVPLTPGNVLRIVLAGGLMQCVVSCHHDVWAVETGMIEIHNDAARRKRSPVEIVNSFGVVGFTLVGASYAGSCLMAYRALAVQRSLDLGNFLLLLFLGLLLMGTAAGYYAIRERTQILQFLGRRGG